MATLEKIRNRAGLVIIVIGLGIVAFLLGDLLKSGGSMFRGQDMQVADIDGTSVSITDYQEYISEIEDYYKLNSGSSSLDENTTQRVREQAWNQMVQDIIMSDKYESLGIEVSAEELLDMATGKNIHPNIRQMFTNPQTGLFEKAQVINFLKTKNSDPQSSFYWSFLEKQIKNERLYSKYRDLIKKGTYVTTAQANAEANAKQNKVNFDFIVKNYRSIADSTITISDSEIEAYYNEHIDNYKQEASRDVEYISFEVLPTAEDKQMTEEWVINSKEAFSNPETDAIQYVNMNSENDYIDKNLSLAQISSSLQDFVANAAVNDVYGPYLENDTYKLSRLVAVKQIPDSVKARHILINGNSPEQNQSTADSLTNLIKKGVNFAQLARDNSQDTGSAINGGDLGWFGEGKMVKPFNDACFNGKKGETVQVESQFGIHIINIQAKGKATTKYNVATLERKISYSSKTNQNMYSQAAKFAALNNSYESFNESITADNLVKRYGRGIKANDRTVGSLESPRELVRWAFEGEVGDMSPIFELGDEYVIAYITSATEKGYKNVADVKTPIERILRNEKKAELLIAEIEAEKSNANSFETLAGSLDCNIQNASDINFASYQVPGAGVEPSLVALATSSKEGEISAPVAGNLGVYVVRVTSSTPSNISVDSERTQLQQAIGYQVDYRAFETIKNETEITDNRGKFF